jgi:hypothetical protein
MVRQKLVLALFLAILVTRPVRADIVVDFYSHDFGRNFPHAFVKAKGIWNSNGKAVDDTFGFTAKRLSPAILAGPVPGDFEPIAKHALAVSKIRFSVVVQDAQYSALLAVVAQWRKNPTRNYDLENRNCVHFAGEAAQAIGLNVTFPKQLMKSPRKYLLHVAQLNPGITVHKPRSRHISRTAPPSVSVEKSAKTVSIY